MTPIYPVQPQIKAATAEALDMMPKELLNVIAGYMATIDYCAVSWNEILFDDKGDVIYPEVREAYKEVFMSSYCDPQHKEAVMRTIFYPRLSIARGISDLMKNEVAKIFEEIVTAGYFATFEGVDLSDLVIVGINWSRVCLSGADLHNTVLKNVAMPDADLRNMNVKNGEWTDVSVDRSKMAGTALGELRLMERVSATQVIGLKF